VSAASQQISVIVELSEEVACQCGPCEVTVDVNAPALTLEVDASTADVL
jgi:hypothetical protein